VKLPQILLLADNVREHLNALTRNVVLPNSESIGAGVLPDIQVQQLELQGAEHPRQLGKRLRVDLVVANRKAGSRDVLNVQEELRQPRLLLHRGEEALEPEIGHLVVPAVREKLRSYWKSRSRASRRSGT